MKKNYLLMLCGLLLTVGCGKTDYSGYSGAGVEASVSASINNTLTRATGTLWDSGDCIGITSSLGADFVNIKYQYAGNNSFSVVNAANAIYVKSTTGETLTAYYPYAGSDKTSAGTIAVTAGTAAQGDQPSIDFLYASATASIASPSVVFQFDHMMSKVNFVFEEGTNMTLADLKYTITGIYTAGTFNTETGTATAGTSDSDKGNIEDIAVALPASGDMTSSLILLPQQSTNVRFDIEVGNTYYTATIANLNLLSKYEYTYTVTINASDGTTYPTLEISETSSINGWQDGGNSGITAEEDNGQTTPSTGGSSSGAWSSGGDQNVSSN